MKLVGEIINGQEIKKVPKWNGITGITTILDNSVTTIRSIKTNKDKAFVGNDWIDQAPLEFDGKLNDAYTAIQNEKITHTNLPQTTNTPITPIYVSTYGPTATARTILNAIKKDFDTRIVEGGKILKEGKLAVEDLSATDNAIDSINGVADTIKGFEGTFTELETSIVTPMGDILDLMNAYGDLALTIIFGVMGGLSVLSILFLNLYAICKQRWAKCILVLIWNIVTLIMTILFLISSIFGIVGIVSIDGVGVVKVIIGEDNLKSTKPIILPTEISSYLVTCLYGDGDLSSNFDLTEAAKIDELNKLKEQIDEVKANIESNKNSIAIKTVDDQYDEIMNDFRQATKALPSGLETFEKQLDDLNALTKGKTSFDDMWVPDKSFCTDSDYPYLLYDDAAPLKKCFVVSEYTTGGTRYNGFNIDIYLTTLQTYDTRHKAILGLIKTENEKLDLEFAQVSEKLITSINNINLYVLDPLTKVFGDFVGDKTVFSLVNCKFMGGHIYVFLDQLQAALGLNFYNISILFGAMSFCLFLGITFLIIAINRCKPINKSNIVNDEQFNNDSRNRINPESIYINKR